MKTVILLRHAKTERENPGGDHARELTERGRNDAEAAARSITDSGPLPDLVIASTAVRAMQTAEILIESFPSPVSLELDPDIYLAPLDQLVEVVRALPNEADRVVVVGHNPGMLELINWFLEAEAERDHLPTAAFAVVESELPAWSDLDGPAGVAVSPTFVP